MKTRKSGIELLRIICIVLLLCTHEHSFKEWPWSGKFQYILADFLTRYSVPVFIMISSLYYEDISKGWFAKIKKIFTYYLFIFIIRNVILILHYGDDISIMYNYLLEPLSIITDLSWYIKGYIITITLMQFINLKISIKQSLILWVFFLVAPFVTWWFDNLNQEFFKIRLLNGEIATFNWKIVIEPYSWILIFMLITISRPVIIEVKKMKTCNIWKMIISLIAIKLTLDFISIKLWNVAFDPRGFNTLFNTIIPLLLVVAFSRINLHSNKINKLGSLTIIVYLIENNSLISKLIIKYWFIERTPFNYFMTITVKLTLYFFIAYLIQKVVHYFSAKYKNLDT